MQIFFSFLFCYRPLPSDNDNAVPVDREKRLLPHFFQYQHKHPRYTSIQNSIKSQSLPGEMKKRQQPPQIATFLSSEEAKLIPNPSPKTAPPDPLKQKLQHANNSQFHSYPSPKAGDIFKNKPQSGQLDSSKPKPNTSPEVSRHKIPRGSNISSPPISRSLPKTDSGKPARSCFKSTSPWSETSGITAGSSSTKSPLIIDKNETFTIYRDPALVSCNSENSSSATISSSHIASYLHPHLHSLHSPSPHSPCLTPVSHPHAASHLLSPHTSALPHPHLLPPGVLPAIPPPAPSILGGHPRLDSSSGLGHITLPHPASAHQQQFLPVRFMLIYREI